MGVVKEHIIFEKFTENGDPVADMGIGIKHQIKEFLIQNGEKKFIHSDELMLIACCAWNKINWVKYLLDIGTDVNVDTGAPLRYAAFSGYIRLMKLLIDYGADINARSPLGWAIDGKRYEAAKLLLNKGADVHFSEDKALRTAVGHNYVELTRLLLLYGADIHGWHDWILKEKKNCSNQMKKIIDDHLAKEKNIVKENLNEKFTEDSDPIADMNIGMMHQIKLWMESMDKLFGNKDHVLACSAGYGKLDFVKYLLAAGADVHANNDWALQWASKNGHIKIVKVLLAAGADVHAKDDYALRWASYYGHTEVVKVLKDHIAKENRIKENLNEKFTEDSDPIEDLDIGLKAMIKKWFISNGATENQYKKYVIINKEGKISVSIGLTLTRWVTKELPNFIQFEVIHGDFDISHCNLTTLKGCPERVFGNFSCSGNDLTSLQYSPEEVKYTYDCRNNKKQFTTREVKKYCKTLGDMIMV